MPRLSLLVVCADCHAAVPRTGNTQKYCGPCSNRRDGERKMKWKKSNPPTEEQKARANDLALSRASAVRAYGKEASEGRSMVGSLEAPALEWRIQISLPFDQNLSKNALWRTGRRGHVYLRQQAKAARDGIMAQFHNALRGKKVRNNKVWIDLFVQKPHHKGDAINLVDSVCDALKKATGVDDRWFCIRSVDWEIVKSDPMIYIGVGQEECADSIACSSCGKIKSLDQFTKNASAKLGVSRNCRDCVSGARKLAKQEEGS